MAVIVPWRAVSLSGKRTVTSPAVTLDPKTSVVRLRVRRPTSMGPAINWADDVVAQIACVVELDGVAYRATWTERGGVLTGRDGQEHTEWVAYWELPVGFFGAGEGLDRSQWPTLKARRWGETAKGGFRAWAEIALTGGGLSSEIQVEADAEDAPSWEFHHSIAYDTQTSAGANSGTTVSVSFTAGAGSNRAAVVVMGTDRSGFVSGHTVTYGSASPSVARRWNVNDGLYSRSTADVFIDTEIGSGAKTVQGVAAESVDGGIALAVLSFSGVDQTTPAGTAVTAVSNSGGNPSVTVGSVNATDMLVDGWGSWSTGTTPTPGASQTQRVGRADGSWRLNASTQSGADGGVMSYTLGGGEYSGGAVALKEAAGGTDATVSGVQATASAEAKTPSISTSRNPTVAGEKATASAEAKTPTVSATQNATVAGEEAIAATEAPAPTVSTTRNPTVSGQQAAVTAEAKAPSISASRHPTVAGEAASASAAANAPAISAGAVIAAAEAIIAADAQAPTITATRNVSITVATATAGTDAKAGAISVVSAGTVAAAVATVAAAAAAPVITATRSVTVQAVQAVAIAAAYAVTIGEVIAQAVRRVFMRNSRGIVP